VKGRLTRVILYVQDVERLAAFYRDLLDLSVCEHIAGEWCVLSAGQCELALHRAGEGYRFPEMVSTSTSNVKLVISVERELGDLRDELLAKGVPMREIKSFGTTGPLCDGTDPEGNVFQLSQAR
jgi:predicted enzyme related to lactoylglutathione lyase